MKVPITQSKSWQNLQESLGEISFLEAGNGYQYLAILKTTPAGNYLYLPYGPVCEDKSGFDNALKSLKSLANKNQAIFIRIESQDPKLVSRFPANTKKSTEINPKETWVLDLTGDDQSFKSRLPSRLIRYHKNAAKNGLKIIKSHDPDDIKYLVSLQKSLAHKKNIHNHSEKYLKTQLAQPFSTLYLVEYTSPDTSQKDIVAAGLVFDDKYTRYNLQGAQSDQGRKLHATGILTIELIIDARKNSRKSFDFWGIAPENAPKNHPWAGFTQFKKTFKGTEVQYAGTYDIILHPARYKIYQLLRKLNNLF